MPSSPPLHVAQRTLLCSTSGTRARPSTLVRSNKKTDIAKQGLNGIENEVVKNNLMGRSRFQNKKDWVDASGRKGKVHITGGCCRGWVPLKGLVSMECPAWLLLRGPSVHDFISLAE